MNYNKSVLASVVLSIALVGCGGGGGGDSSNPYPNVPSENIAPQPVITSDTRNTFFNNQELKFSASKSKDANHDKLTYRWHIQSQPTGSKARIKLPNQVNIRFTPDLEGEYVLVLTVSDGFYQESTEFSFSISPQIKAYQLAFKPSLMEYNKVANVFVGFDDETDILHIINGNDSTNASIPLEDDILRLKLSPNGKYALSLHRNHISFIDLEKKKLIKTYPNDGPYSDIFVTDRPLGYLVGLESGQWSQSVVKLDLQTGQYEHQLRDYHYAYGDIKGIYSKKHNKFLFLEFGISPQDLKQISLDKNGNAIDVKDSPYHGEYEFGDGLFLDSNENFVYSSSGNYFNANSLNYAGRLKIANQEKIHRLIDVAHQKKLISINAPSDYFTAPITQYLPYFYEYNGLAYSKVNQILLPMINNQRSYAVDTFVDSQQNLTVIAQVGSDNPYAANLEYYWLDYGKNE